MRSLQGRIVLIVLGVLILGLGSALGATFGAVQDWSNERDDAVLLTAGEEVAEELRAGGQLAQTGDQGNPAGVWESMAERGEVPSFFAVYEADGSLVQSIDYGQAPPGAATLAQDLEVEPDSDPLFARSGWLLHAVDLPQSRTLIVGMRTDLSRELLGRTRAVAITCSVVGVLGGGLLAGFAVRHQLRPLQTMARTAEHIGHGDLGKRVPAGTGSDEVDHLGAALNTMLGQLEKAFSDREASERRVRRFVSDASHELRTPVAMIRGHAELFRRGASTRPEDLEKVMSRIEETSQRMGTMIEEMLLLASLDERRPLQREWVNLSDVVAGAVADASALDPVRVIDSDIATVPQIDADPDRLHQVMANLLGNVLRHTPTQNRATVSLGQEGTHAVITIQDTGPGLTQAQAARAFERFYRADQPESSPSIGSGLGLPIVAAIIEAHGGRVALESTLGVGTTVAVHLPLAP
ncbi:MAG TPA: HAMP domain-containing sensor histidine kinase [Beutenbergiaceae bacterium]|nr:HAMP domain-containing sensor histidine kinase [Beutenbergiaceae bacterium]